MTLPIRPASLFSGPNQQSLPPSASPTHVDTTPAFPRVPARWGHPGLWAALLGLWLASSAAAAPPGGRTRFEAALRYTESQRAFLQDGPGFLLSQDDRVRFMELPSDGRDAEIARLLPDPNPQTPENELVLAIERRRALVRSEGLSFQDSRARLVFLHGKPQERELIDCREAFKPLELWSYPGFKTAVLFQPEQDDPWRLWLPVDGKGVLYTEETLYYLEQAHELRRAVSFRRNLDHLLCEEADKVDDVTGIEQLFEFRNERPTNGDFLGLLDPPADLARWAERVLATTEPAKPQIDGELAVSFPERRGQRMVTRLQIKLPTPDSLPVFTEGEVRERRFVLQGHLEQADEIFEEFRVRFQIPSPAEGSTQPLALIAERLLRPGQLFLLRLQLIEEVGQQTVHFSRAIEIPSVITQEAVAELPGDVVVALGQSLEAQRLEGSDSLLLVPPVSDIVFGLWRAEALVTGSRIEKVRFLVDGVEQMSRKTPPFSTELRLSTIPREQVVRVEGWDKDGQLVAADEVIVNQPRGELRIRILEPARGRKAQGEVAVKAEVVVPEEKRLVRVEFLVNEQLQLTLERPPWEGKVQVDSVGELDYLTAVAVLEDGSRAEDVRFVNAPAQLEELDIDLVELFTTVTDGGGRPVGGLQADQFTILEDGKPQKIAKFELVEDLPLHLGIVIDTSGSMAQSMGEAQRAATGFLEKIITSRDRCFALAFSDKPRLLMERTSDVGAVAERLEELVANGATALHDAVVSSLYYFRGIRGRKALVLLSDGEDTISTLPYRDALEYARRSGVPIYAIGLKIGKLQMSVRSKLDELASQTGGRTFYIEQSTELDTVYAEIERELRSQYLLAYSSSQRGKEGFRTIEVQLKNNKLNARTLRGYYP